MASNVLLALTMDRPKKEATPRLELTTHPFSRLRNLGVMERLTDALETFSLSGLLCFLGPLGMAIFAAMFIIPLVEEKVCNVGLIFVLCD